MSALLTIDESKIAELMRAARPGYVAIASNLPSITVPEIGIPSIAISGTPSPAVSFGVDAREYLASLRRKIVESGVELKSPEELDKEIDEMRGRNAR
jgi:hypothetical protein